MTDCPYDAVVLAGGRSRRMGVPDKTRVTVAGASMLDRTLQAVAGARCIVVVGEPRTVAAEVVWARERPVGGGPAAAVSSALEHVAADLVVVLAGDLPLVTTSDVQLLVDAVSADGAVYVDSDGREQWLCSAWRSSSLRQAPLTAGGSMRAALAGLNAARLRAPVMLMDCDTPEDLARAEEMLT